VVVGDDEDALADSGPADRRGEGIGGRQRVAPLPLDRQVGQLVDPEERRAGNVRVEVALATGLDPGEVVAAVDEAVLDQ
jgi:hypothetical protein